MTLLLRFRGGRWLSLPGAPSYAIILRLSRRHFYVPWDARSISRILNIAFIRKISISPPPHVYSNLSSALYGACLSGARDEFSFQHFADITFFILTVVSLQLADEVAGGFAIFDTYECAPHECRFCSTCRPFQR